MSEARHCIRKVTGQRQTPQQVGRHPESTRLQYGLVYRALQLGWYGKHLDRMDKFFRLNPVQRALFLDDKVLANAADTFVVRKARPILQATFFDVADVARA